MEYDLAGTKIQIDEQEVLDMMRATKLSRKTAKAVLVTQKLEALSFEDYCVAMKVYETKYEGREV